MRVSPGTRLRPPATCPGRGPDDAGLALDEALATCHLPGTRLWSPATRPGRGPAKAGLDRNEALVAHHLPETRLCPDGSRPGRGSDRAQVALCVLREVRCPDRTTHWMARRVGGGGGASVLQGRGNLGAHDRSMLRVARLPTAPPMSAGRARRQGAGGRAARSCRGTLAVGGARGVPSCPAVFHGASHGTRREFHGAPAELGGTPPRVPWNPVEHERVENGSNFKVGSVSHRVPPNKLPTREYPQP